MLKGYVSTDEVERLLREWLDLYGRPTPAELSIRFRIQPGEGRMLITYAASLGADPWPDVSAVAYSLQGADAAIRPGIIKEREHYRKEFEGLQRSATQHGFRLVPIEAAAKPQLAIKLSDGIDD